MADSRNACKSSQAAQSKFSLCCPNVCLLFYGFIWRRAPEQCAASANMNRSKVFERKRASGQRTEVVVVVAKRGGGRGGGWGVGGDVRSWVRMKSDDAVDSLSAGCQSIN